MTSIFYWLVDVYRADKRRFYEEKLEQAEGWVRVGRATSNPDQQIKGLMARRDLRRLIKNM